MEIMKILGDYHVHTYFSDGKASVMDMALAAKEKGLAEIAISDHCFGKCSGALRRGKFRKMRAEIEQAREILPVYMSVESNLVTVDGQLDIDDGNIDAKFDFINFGVHMFVFYSFRALLSFGLPNMFWALIRYTPGWQRRYNTRLVRRVLERNNITIYTHPNRYFKVDVVELAHLCAQKGILMELNNKNNGLKPIEFERCVAAGAKFIISSDAHKPKHVGNTTRIDEFLKQCTYDPSVIINLNQTLTEYKKDDKLFGRSENGTDESPDDGKPKRKPRRFTRFF